jgi:hypothetical protein
MAYACRGSVNLAHSCIENEYFSTSFTVYDGHSQKFYLKAKNEYEKQKWLVAIEVSKNKFIRDDFYLSKINLFFQVFVFMFVLFFLDLKANDYKSLLVDLKQKLIDLNQCYNLIEINNNELEKLLESLEKLCLKDLNNNNNNNEIVLNESLFDLIHDKAKSLKICLTLIVNNMKTFTKLANKIGDEKENVMEIELFKEKQ